MKKSLNNLREKRKEMFVEENIKNIYFERLDLKWLKEELCKHIKFNVRYSFLLKIRRDDGGFGMGGEQIGFKCDYNNYECEVWSLYDDLKDRIEEFKREYFDCEIIYMQLMFISLRVFPKLQLKNINKLKLDKQLVNIGESKEYFNNSVLPLTLNDFYYGTRLKHTVDNKGIVQSVFIEDTNLIDLFKTRLSNKEFKGFSGDVIFYLYINDLGRKFVIVSRKIDSCHTYKEVYNTNGTLIVKIDDYKINDVTFDRSIRNTTLTVKNSSIAKINITHTFNTFKDNYIAFKSIVNPNIGTLDLETYRHTRDGKSYVFCLGFKISKGEEKKFFLGKNENSQSLILKCIDSMLISKYNGYTFYIHNFGGYDAIFILKALNDYNVNIGDLYYQMNTPVFRDNRLLRLNIKIKTKSGGFIKISLLDSYSLLPEKLSQLSKSFQCEVTKGLYPYKFVNETNLNYIGETPDKVFYKKINENKYKWINEDGYQEIDESEYNSIKRSDWNLKEETMHYLSKDLNSLMCVIEKFNRYIYRKYDIQITDCLTIARLSINIFLKHYLGEAKLPLIKKVNVFNFIKQGYFGGITEVYRPICGKANYYDVNSLYPFASKNPIPGTEMNYVEDLTGEGLNLDDVFGYFYCKVKTNDLYLGLLPLHIDNNLILPNGTFYGIWFSEELKFAKEHGYDIHVIKGYNFNKVYNVFDNFVDKLYDIKLNSEGSIKSITKLILNSLFGRLGMSLNKSVTKIVNREELELLLLTRKIKELYIKLTKDQYLVTFNTEISKPQCDKNEIDFFKVLNEENKDHEDNYRIRDVSISTAAAVTSYARIYMNKIKILILSLGGKIYYMDTDSIVTDILLPDNLLGNKLGQFKLEHVLLKGYFLSSKTYCLNLEDGKEVIKAKGIKTNTLKTKDFDNMYYNNFDIKAIKTNSEINYAEGYVNIDENQITLNHDAYTKREKIYDNGLWVNTKPLVIFSENKQD